MEGLQILGMIDLIRKLPEQMKDKFLASSTVVPKEKLIKELDFSIPTNEAEKRAKSFLLEYVGLEKQATIGNDGKCPRLVGILTFGTGQQVIGSAGLPEKITVEYSSLKDNDLPAAGTCGNNSLIIPTKHESFEIFKEKMDKAFELELTGFGEA